jgi:hypothetical protein
VVCVVCGFLPAAVCVVGGFVLGVVSVVGGFLLGVVCVVGGFLPAVVCLVGGSRRRRPLEEAREMLEPQRRGHLVDPFGARLWRHRNHRP